VSLAAVVVAAVVVAAVVVVVATARAVEAVGAVSSGLLVILDCCAQSGRGNAATAGNTGLGSSRARKRDECMCERSAPRRPTPLPLRS
jgi:hypothetical protein